MTDRADRVQMRSHRVVIVASYPPEIGQLLEHFTRTPRGSDVPTGLPHWKTTAVDWSTSEDASGCGLWQTLTVTYDVEGRDPAEADRFARAIFDWEATRANLPQNEAVIVRGSE
jgi:hypothetical protein